MARCRRALIVELARFLSDTFTVVLPIGAAAG
jgi:hypothetical protein